MSQRSVTMKGSPLSLGGNEVKVGDKAPDFQVVNTDLNPESLSTLGGKVLVICAVPSLDTSVCDTEIRKFNDEAKKLGGGVKVICLSADLPFAQKRWCGAAGVNAVTPLSDYKDMTFANAYGIYINDLRLLARAVFVIDSEGVIRYIQVVPELTNEPDYQAALKAVADLT